MPTSIRVPAGAFPMGTSDADIESLCQQYEWAKEWKSKGHFDKEPPQHTVELKEYRIGQHPVTNAEYV